MKRLAIIGAGHMARNYAENAREIGIETYCFAYVKGAIARDFVNHFFPISIFDIDKIVDVCLKEGIQGVVSTTELTVAIAAEVARRLGLPGIDPSVAASLTNKYSNREASKGVESLFHPKYALIHSLNDLALEHAKSRTTHLRCHAKNLF